MAFVRSFRRCADKAPDVFVQFGLEQQFRFISHPGVMAISKLLEMRTISQMRANFTQENIEKIKGFDPDLARKAQIALDNKLPVNFQQLELIDETLPRLLEEKKQLGVARSEVAKLPVGGPYAIPKSVDVSACRPIPGQKDIQGTLLEVAESMYPGMAAQVAPGIKMSQAIASGAAPAPTPIAGKKE
ncbi:unnamed protein product [Polarella glacialis]|uniref:Uncharacterized protein n=1 Tax=Polarella glacialis TaxID=89957 RepID=A0A813LWM2_POLGL|nr:unnamed protein product [Polarella glacialis]CAE8740082.1 unnamed protein product [Polarella glacialis]|mmetsp:Transcript_8811/g.16385  ORF Transcript_8811/g.16385 Transcript_8811/m.16385 type:complete len:187 (+) Transcript_8811:62-622(+)